MYGKREVRKPEDMKGLKVRVQATATEDLMFPAYSAQTVHMPFGSVYTSLQTGVVDFGENAVNVYMINKHYEVAPVMSMTSHEANNCILWISDKLWQSLNDDQKKWVTAAARDVSVLEPKRAFELENSAATQLEKHGRQDRQGRRQGELPEDRRSLSRQARQGSRPACRQDQDADPRDQLARSYPRVVPANAGPIRRGLAVEMFCRPTFANNEPVVMGPCFRRDDERATMPIADKLVLQRQHHLKWPAFDRLELFLMIVCGMLCFGFSLSVTADIATRTIGRPWLWLQEVTSTLFIYAIFIGAAVATRRNDHLYLTAVSESMHGTPRLIVEIIIRVVVLAWRGC